MKFSRPIFFLLGFLVLATVTFGWPTSNPAPGSPPARVHAQAGSVPATGVALTLYDNIIDWKTTPSTQVRAEVRSSGATNLRSAGQAVSNADGDIRINLGGGGGGPGGGGGGGNANLRPGDQIRLIPQGGVTATLTVPTFGADANLDGDSLVGVAPAGAMVSIALNHAGATSNHSATAGGDGAWSVGLGGTVDVAPGDTGMATLVTAEGNTIRAEFAGLTAIASMGARQLTGDATPGNQVSMGIRGSGGANKGNRTTTVQGGGTDWQAGQGGGGGGPGGGPNAFGPVAVGDTITVAVRSALPGASRSVTGVVPNITIDVDAATRTVRGVGPVGAPVEVEAESPEGQVYRAQAQPDPGGAPGAFRATLPDAEGLGPGWRVSTIVTVAPGLRIRALDALEQVSIGVHTGVVTGVADPGMEITATLKAADGTVKDTDADTSGGQGTFNMNFGGGPGGGGPGGGVDIEVGDFVEVEFIAGDPVIIAIPPVSARTDPAADTVSGLAPAGTQVTVVRTGGGGGPGGGGQPPVTVRTTTAGDGRYTASFTGQLDVVPPMGGSVTIRLASGHQLFTTWAAVRMTLEIGNNFLTGNGPAGRTVTASLVDQGVSSSVAAGDDDIGGGGGGPGGGGGNNWQLAFEDTLNQPVNIRVADTVHAEVGDDVIDLVVPPLSGVAFVADDLVNGKTTPNRTLSMTVQRLLGQGAQTVQVTADANGNFSHSFAGTFDLQHNDVIIFQTQESFHIIISRLAVPGLRLNLDDARLTGSWAPTTDLEATLQSGTKTVRATMRTGEDATFDVVLMDGSQRAQPKTGDVVTVRVPGQPADELRLVVPELTTAGDVDANTAGGRATPGGVLQLTVQNTFPRGGFGGGGGPGGGGQNTRNVRPTINADGTWTTGFQPPYDVAPGTRMAMLYREPGGHLVERTRYVPIANVQHGGGNVCGFADPRASVDATLAGAGGATVGSASGQAGYDSTFNLEMVDAAKAPVLSESGQTARVRLGGTPVDVPLPPLAVAVTWGQNQVTVTGPPQTQVFILRPARQCLDVAQRLTVGAQTNVSGTLTAPVGFGIDPGEGLEVALYAPNGHRVYRHVFRSLGQVFVETDKVTGRATPLSNVTVALVDAGGAERARATTKANSDGVFDVRFKSGGNPVVIRATDKVRLEASGESPEIQVEPLAFDWSRGDIVTLQATPGRSLQFQLAIEGHDDIVLPLTLDATGTFKFEAKDIPPRAGFTLDDIIGVRAVIETSNGHQIVAQAGETPEVEPPTTASRVYLPLAIKQVRLR